MRISSMLCGLLVSFVTFYLLQHRHKDVDPISVTYTPPPPPAIMKQPTRNDKPITEEELHLAQNAALTTMQWLQRWEIARVEVLQLEESVRPKMKVIILPPYPEDVINFCRRNFERELLEFIATERISFVIEKALEEWQSINRFSDQWQLISYAYTDGEIYSEKFNNRSQITLKPGGGFILRRDDTIHNPTQWIPHYGSLNEVTVERYEHLFSN